MVRDYKSVVVRISVINIFLSFIIILLLLGTQALQDHNCQTLAEQTLIIYVSWSLNIFANSGTETLVLRQNTLTLGFPNELERRTETLLKRVSFPLFNPQGETRYVCYRMFSHLLKLRYLRSCAFMLGFWATIRAARSLQLARESENRYAPAGEQVGIVAISSRKIKLRHSRMRWNNNLITV